MTLPTAPVEVWFLTGSQGLYGPQTLEQVAQQSRGLAEQLDASPDIEARVVWRPVLTSPEVATATRPSRSRRSGSERSDDERVAGAVGVADERRAAVGVRRTGHALAADAGGVIGAARDAAHVAGVGRRALDVDVEDRAVVVHVEVAGHVDAAAEERAVHARRARRGAAARRSRNMSGSESVS